MKRRTFLAGMMGLFMRPRLPAISEVKAPVTLSPLLPEVDFESLTYPPALPVLHKKDWISLDRAVIEASRVRLKTINDTSTKSLFDNLKDLCHESTIDLPRSRCD